MGIYHICSCEDRRRNVIFFFLLIDATIIVPSNFHVAIQEIIIYPAATENNFQSTCTQISNPNEQQPKPNKNRNRTQHMETILKKINNPFMCQGLTLVKLMHAR